MSSASGGGGSTNSPTLIGTTKDARLIIIGIRYARVLATGKAIAFEYTADVIPIAVSFHLRANFNNGSNIEVRKSIFGAGLSPIGFQLEFRRRKRVKPFINTSAGFLYFRDPVPDSRGTQFNFSFDFGGGLRLFTLSRRVFTAGYKYHHFSNANRAQINPGFDANIFYVGFSVVNK